MYAVDWTSVSPTEINSLQRDKPSDYDTHQDLEHSFRDALYMQLRGLSPVLQI